MTKKHMGLQPPPLSADEQAARQADQAAQVWGQVLQSTISRAIREQPRSQQTAIGPSEIGMACDHCLAAKLAGWTKHEPGTAWLPFIGTAVHAELERIFQAEHELDLVEGYDGLFQVEKRVNVGTILGEPIWGSTDLFIQNIGSQYTPGMTVDWKIVGQNTLRTVKRDRMPTAQYRVQAHAYARGWTRAGWDVSHVAIFYLPRNAMAMSDGYFWSERYDEQVAVDALDRAERIARNLQALETATGTTGRDQYITSLDRDPECWDCKKYGDFQADPVTGATSLNTVLNVPATTPQAPPGDLNTVLGAFPGSNTTTTK